ncbi:hypothetical protein [Blastococcus sp. CCUG 61487]|uniref:hypothetical protein n=1 Tax=Blastococcus sp. CCUG 61487 TaxID=1840703 RepID=UPI001485B001|nr:hypothetical protein [Blastococcus sp. CCUG 61487]
MWTPTPDEDLERELRAALARPGASWVSPPKPVAVRGRPGHTGWLWGRMRTAEGAWLGLATVHQGFFFERPLLDWYRAEQLRVL